LDIGYEISRNEVQPKDGEVFTVVAMCYLIARQRARIMKSGNAEQDREDELSSEEADKELGCQDVPPR
jgi:hypothetical protein